jgi:hypothetical protein
MTAAPGDSAASARRLHLVFEDAAVFVSEYDRNLARGGAMIASRDVFDLREVVDVVLEAPFAGAKHVLRAEVVHADGHRVAVQFLDPAPTLRERLEPLRDRAEELAAKATPDRFEDDSLVGPPDDDELDDVSLDPAALGLDAAAAASIQGFESTSQSRDADDGDPNERTFRARAERAATRVAVQVHGPTGKALTGRTRDVSNTGLLVSIDGEELPVGRAVQVSITHPDSGEKMTVPAKVVRHLHGDGVVSAVAIELRPGERGSEVERFVSEIQEADAAKLRGGIRGPLEELGGASLLQMFSALAKRGTLTVSHGVEEGCVAFEAGMLLFAQVGSVQGTKALARILSWRDGFFEFRAHVDPVEPSAPGLPMEGAILDAVRMLDEANRLSGPLLPPGARFELARDRLAETGAPLGKTEQAVLELAAAGFTVRRILDVIPENDAAIRVAISALMDRGYLHLARNRG